MKKINPKKMQKMSIYSCVFLYNSRDGFEKLDALFYPLKHWVLRQNILYPDKSSGQVQIDRFDYREAMPSRFRLLE